MKKLAALVAVASMLSTAAFAGGPVDIPPEPELPRVEGPASSVSNGAVIAGLAGLALVAALASSDSSDNTTGE